MKSSHKASKSLRERLGLPLIDLEALSREMDAEDDEDNRYAPAFRCPFCGSINISLNDDGSAHCNDCGSIYSI